MGPHQLCWGSTGTWSCSVTAATPRLGGFALLLRRAWLQTSRDKAAWIWWVVVCRREIFTSRFCCFNLIWEVFTSSYYYYIYNYSYCTRTHILVLYVHTFYDVVWNRVHTTTLVLYIYFVGFRLHVALAALAFTIFHYHSCRKCPLYCTKT